MQVLPNRSQKQTVDPATPSSETLVDSAVILYLLIWQWSSDSKLPCQHPTPTMNGSDLTPPTRTQTFEQECNDVTGSNRSFFSFSYFLHSTITSFFSVQCPSRQQASPSSTLTTYWFHWNGLLRWRQREELQRNTKLEYDEQQETAQLLEQLTTLRSALKM